MTETVTIRLRLHGYLRRAVADRELVLKVRGPLREAWADVLGQVDGLEAALARVSCVVLVNGVSLRLGDVADPWLADGDVVEIVPVAAGGSQAELEWSARVHRRRPGLGGQSGSSRIIVGVVDDGHYRRTLQRDFKAEVEVPVQR